MYAPQELVLHVSTLFVMSPDWQSFTASSNSWMTYIKMFWYAVVFFAVPCVRAAYCAWENGNIKRRNNARRERAGAALREIVAAREEKGRAAASRKNFIKIVDEDDEPDGGA